MIGFQRTIGGSMSTTKDEYRGYVITFEHEGDSQVVKRITARYGTDGLDALVATEGSVMTHHAAIELAREHIDALVDPGAKFPRDRP